MRKFETAPITARQAKWSIFAIMLLGVLYVIALPFLITITGTWRGWSLKPAAFWRPFTPASFLLAASAVFFWSRMAGGWFAGLVFGSSGPAGSNQMFQAFVWIIASYLPLTRVDAAHHRTIDPRIHDRSA